MQKPDSIIFDMDGTLWDAVETYAKSWNQTFEALKIDKYISRDELAKMVGWEGRKVLKAILEEYDEETQDSIYKQVIDLRRELIYTDGGQLYEGVMEGLAALSQKYKLFIVSNCAVGVIRLFIDWAGIDEYIMDEIAYGTNYQPKSFNIKALIEKYGLQNPVYVGDTGGDGEQSRLAGIPFVFVSYGFGGTDDYDLKFDDFNAFTHYFMCL